MTYNHAVTSYLHDFKKIEIIDRPKTKQENKKGIQKQIILVFVFLGKCFFLVQKAREHSWKETTFCNIGACAC